jgi:hypothetical protein
LKECFVVQPSFPKKHVRGVASVAVKPEPLAHQPVTAGPVPAAVAAATRGDVSQRAYDLYVEGGRQEGMSEAHWRQAEEELRVRGAAACHEDHRRKSVFAPDAAE